jgi:hypothetical protein
MQALAHCDLGSRKPTMSPPGKSQFLCHLVPPSPSFHLWASTEIIIAATTNREAIEIKFILQTKL